MSLLGKENEEEDLAAVHFNDESGVDIVMGSMYWMRQFVMNNRQRTHRWITCYLDNSEKLLC